LWCHALGAEEGLKLSTVFLVLIADRTLFENIPTNARMLSYTNQGNKGKREIYTNKDVSASYMFFQQHNTAN